MSKDNALRIILKLQTICIIKKKKKSTYNKTKLETYRNLFTN